MKYLLFRLYSPLSSWGDIAVGETRPSFSYPGKSAILGLIAGALGIRRQEENKHAALAESLGFAVLVELMGDPLTDYHTIQVPSGERGYCSRKSELSGDRNELNTILSTRDYRLDGLYTIALWEKIKSNWDLSNLADALKKPVFIPYLGRKSCPPALPFQPQIIESDTLVSAFKKTEFLDPANFGITVNDHKLLFWDECDHSGVDCQQVYERRDFPSSRIRWQFDVRKEQHAALDFGGEHVHQ